MKKYIVAFVALFISIATFSDPARTDSLCVIQPNGDTLWTYLHGDEFYHWRSTIDGYVIVRDTDNYFYYAVVDADSIQASNIIARNLENRSVVEREFVNTNSALVQQFIHSTIQDIDKTIEPNDTSLLPPRQDVVSNNGTREPVVGTRKILTILIDFKDYSFTRTQAEFDLLMNREYGAVGLNNGSVRRYYQENSYGQLDVVSTVVGPFRAEKKRKEYAWKHTGKWWDGTFDIRRLVREAINHAKECVDFSTLDGDGDGYVDCVHVVFAGEGLSSGSNDSYIWPHSSILQNEIEEDGVKIQRYMITPELYLSGQIATIGTICHELGHVLGAPDYYDLHSDINSNECFRAIGEYDVMSGGQWNKSGECPAHHNPYTKCYIFGWDTPTTITAATAEYTISSATTSKGNFYRIDTQTEGEFFLLEHRSYHWFDKFLPITGLLIYHAHKDLESAINNDEDINCAHPLKLYLVNASAESNPNSSPTSYAIMDAKRAFPGVWQNKTMFTSTTIPSAKAWNGSDLGVNLFFIRQTSTTDIEFTVNPQILGPSQLCGTQDYYIVGDLPDCDNVIWSYSTDIAESPMYPALLFDEDNDAGVISIQRGNTIDNPSKEQDSPILRSYDLINPMPFPEVPYVGAVTLNATICGGNDTCQLEKEIILPELATPMLSETFTIWSTDETRTLHEIACSSVNPEYIKWYVRYPNSETEEEFVGRNLTLKPTESGNMTVRIVNDCGCSNDNEVVYTYSVAKFRLMDFPNPVITPILNIEIKPIGVSDEPYLVDLWYHGNRVQHIVTMDNSVGIDVSNLPTGWYQLVLSQNGETLESSNVLIQH